MNKMYRASALALLFSLLIGLTVHSDAQTPAQIIERIGQRAQANEPDPIDEIQKRIQAAGGYEFTAQIEQTLVPRAIPANIGQGAERVDSQLTGQVTLPDHAQLTLRFEAGANLPLLTLEQDGANTYLIQGSERTLIENPLGTSAPGGDFMGYLHAAKDVRLKIDPQHPQFSIYEYDIDGHRFADYVRDLVQDQLPPSQ